MELAKEILNKEIERREILLAVETNVLIQNDMYNEIGGLKDVVKKLTTPVVVEQSEQLADKNFDCFEYSQGFHRCFEQCKKCKDFS